MRLINKINKSTFLLLFSFVLISWQVNAQQHQEDHSTTDVELDNHDIETHSEDAHDQAGHDEESDITGVIMDHVKDSHEWHILTTKEGKHVSFPLPIIVYSKESGLNIFLSNKIAHHHHHNGFQYGEDMVLVKIKKNGERVEADLSKKIVEIHENSPASESPGEGIYYHGEKVSASLPLDFSFTKNVFMMFLAVIILLTVFLSLAKAYKKSGISAPKGLMGFIEPVIVFVEEDIAIPNIGKEKYMKFMPYLLTVFFFILIHNLMGLIPFFPFGASVTGNIAVTMVLALFTMILTNINGNRAYWGHIFAPPGVPLWLYIIMIPVELLGIITKPFALMIRLFANITAGHIIILSLVSLIFIFGSAWMAFASGPLVIFMYCIELLVAFLQAYIFTLLSALFIGLAMPEHHHD